MVNVSEGTFTAPDGQALYTKTWLPDGAPVAKMVMIHGFSDHLGRYYDFFPSLAARGIAVYGFDQRGWGRSVAKPADKGRSGSTATVLSDMAAFIRPHLDGDVPVFVLGHSMGGNEVASLLAAPAGSAYETDIVRKVRGWLLESPFFGWPEGEAPSWFKVQSGRLAGRLLPHWQLAHHIPEEYMSRDPAVIENFRADPLCHNTGTLEGMAALLDRVTELAAGRMPPGAGVQSLWLGHGDGDRCTSFDASRQWFDESAAAVPDKTFRAYPGWRHMLHAEPLEDRQLFYKEVGDWILERASPPTKTTVPAAEPAPAVGEAKL